MSEARGSQFPLCAAAPGANPDSFSARKLSPARSLRLSIVLHTQDMHFCFHSFSWPGRFYFLVKKHAMTLHSQTGIRPARNTQLGDPLSLTLLQPRHLSGEQLLWGCRESAWGSRSLPLRLPRMLPALCLQTFVPGHVARAARPCPGARTPSPAQHPCLRHPRPPGAARLGWAR